jgi:hypothetical protein
MEALESAQVRNENTPNRQKQSHSVAPNRRLTN